MAPLEIARLIPSPLFFFVGMQRLSDLLQPKRRKVEGTEERESEDVTGHKEEEEKDEGGKRASWMDPVGMHSYARTTLQPLFKAAQNTVARELSAQRPFSMAQQMERVGSALEDVGGDGVSVGGGRQQGDARMKAMYDTLPHIERVIGIKFTQSQQRAFRLWTRCILPQIYGTAVWPHVKHDVMTDIGIDRVLPESYISWPRQRGKSTAMEIFIVCYLLHVYPARVHVFAPELSQSEKMVAGVWMLLGKLRRDNVYGPTIAWSPLVNNVRLKVLVHKQDQLKTVHIQAENGKKADVRALSFLSFSSLLRSHPVSSPGCMRPPPSPDPLRKPSHRDDNGRNAQRKPKR